MCTCCLEAVIKSKRDCDVSQKDIAEALGIGEFGFKGEISQIENLLKEYNLSIRHDNPFLNFCGIEDFLETGAMGRLNVIVYYDFSRLRGV